MDQGISLDQVQQAIKQLREEGERVSRRNVRAITGGGMSTVHRMMGLVEEQDALQDTFSTKDVSETFLNALRCELSRQVKAATEGLQKQIILLKAREQEAIEALESSESKVALLEKESKDLEELGARERQEADKALAVDRESIRRLEQWTGDYVKERQDFNEALDAVKAENIAYKFQVETLGEALTNTEKSIDRLTLDLSKTQKALAEAEKKAAVAQQKAVDLKDALIRHERA